MADSTSLQGIARHLVQAGLVSEAVMQPLNQRAREQKTSLIPLLLQETDLSGEQIARCASERFRLPWLDLNAVDSRSLALDQLPQALIRKHQVLPLYKRGNMLLVAMANPANIDALDDIRFQQGLHCEVVVADNQQLESLITQLFQKPEEPLESMLDDDMDNIDIDEDDQNQDDGNISAQSAGEDAPVVRYINRLLVDAINQGASDLHFEPYERHYRVRYRIDGILYEVARPPANLSQRLAARLKVMAQLDIAERRVPQDGRMKLRLSRQRAIDFRISTLPTLWGEKLVLRILDSDVSIMSLARLGMNQPQQDAFLKILKNPQGMLLVTGPTGSGKTITLYTALNILNTSEVNIATAEDPAEINLSGINQVNINPKAGLNFANALRSFLRQDPDIIMVGEIRDLETAEISIKAAQTGHMVLSTVHTNSASETLTRLMNMGVPSYNIASSISLLVAQRLVRKLCPHCKQPEAVPEKILRENGFHENELADIVVYNASGCSRCTKGYRGRVGIFELLPVTEKIARLIMGAANAIEIRDAAIAEGMMSLRAAGLERVREGVTSLAEINRMTLS